MNKVWLGTLLLVASATAYSTAGFFTRLIQVDAWTLLFWRGLFGGSFLAAVVVFQERGRLWRSIRAIGWEGAVVTVCSAVATVCFLNAMRLTAVADVIAPRPPPGYGRGDTRTVMPDRGETHFGFQTVDLDRKQAMVDEVFHRVARRYDLMNDLLSGGLHRAWKDTMVTMLDPPRKGRFAVLDVAGGTGDVAFRIAEAGGPETGIIVCDINPDMLEVGRARAQERGGDGTGRSVMFTRAVFDRPH